jgi:hypothetical protein
LEQIIQYTLLHKLRNLEDNVPRIVIFFLKTTTKQRLDVVVHAYNSRYVEGGSRRIMV